MPDAACPSLAFLESHPYPSRPIERPAASSWSKEDQYRIHELWLLRVSPAILEKMLPAFAKLIPVSDLTANRLASTCREDAGLGQAVGVGAWPTTQPPKQCQTSKNHGLTSFSILPLQPKDPSFGRAFNSLAGLEIPHQQQDASASLARKPALHVREELTDGGG